MASAGRDQLRNGAVSSVNPAVSIIIVANQPGEYLAQALEAIRAIDEPSWEVVGVLHEPHDVDDERMRFFASGETGPSEKRNLGAEHARGEILAFLDDDAYPSRGWLKAALANLASDDVVAVGGPGVTPPDNGFWEQASGWVYASWMGSAGLRYRYTQEARRDVDDYPSMNLVVRRSAFEAAGGFDGAFYPGEDTKLCLELVERGGRIVYEPDALVFHHRRPLIGGHMRQVEAYGRHRGFFAKRLPATSLRPHYFIPSAWSLWMTLGWLLDARSSRLGALHRWSMAIYLAALAISGIDAALKSGRPSIGLAVAPGIVATHLVYGVSFLRGLLGSRPKAGTPR